MGAEFDAFFRENYHLVVASAEYRLSSLTDAEEVAAAAFRIAWQHHAAGGELSVPWLYGVTRNLIGNEYRVRKRRAALVERAAEQVPVVDEAAEDRAEELRSAVATLPQHHQDMLRMAYWDDLTATEIGEVLGLTVPTVHVRLFRARRALRKALMSEMQEVATDGR